MKRGRRQHDARWSRGKEEWGERVRLGDARADVTRIVTETRARRGAGTRRRPGRLAMRERVGDTHGEAGMTLRKRHGARARVHFSKDGGFPPTKNGATGREPPQSRPPASDFGQLLRGACQIMSSPAARSAAGTPLKHQNLTTSRIGRGRPRRRAWRRRRRPRVGGDRRCAPMRERVCAAPRRRWRGRALPRPRARRTWTSRAMAKGASRPRPRLRRLPRPCPCRAGGRGARGSVRATRRPRPSPPPGRTRTRPRCRPSDSTTPSSAGSRAKSPASPPSASPGPTPSSAGAPTSRSRTRSASPIATPTRPSPPPARTRGALGAAARPEGKSARGAASRDTTRARAR